MGTSTIEATGNANSLYLNTGRSLCRDSYGVYHVVYYESDGSYNQIYYEKSTDNGATWGTRTALTDENYDQTTPAICVDSNDDLHVAWYGSHSGKTGYEDVRYIKYAGSWGSIDNIGNTSYREWRPSICVDSLDDVHVFYRRDTGPGSNNNRLDYTKFTTSWSTPDEVGVSGYNQTHASCAVDGNDYLHVTWAGGNADHASFNNTFYMQYTTSWQGINDLTDQDRHSGPGHVIVESDDTTLWIVFDGYSSTSTGYYQIRYVKYTGSWGTADDITSGSVNRRNPSSQRDTNDNITAIYRYESGTHEIFKVIWNTSSWAETSETTSSSNNQTWPNATYSEHPVSGNGAFIHSNIPIDGFCYAWMDYETAKFKYDADIAWEANEFLIAAIGISAVEDMQYDEGVVEEAAAAIGASADVAFEVVKYLDADVDVAADASAWGDTIYLAAGIGVAAAIAKSAEIFKSADIGIGHIPSMEAVSASSDTAQEYMDAEVGTGDWVNAANGTGAPDASCTVSTANNDVVEYITAGFPGIANGADVTGFKVDVWWAREDANEELDVFITIAGKGNSTTQTYTGGGNNTDCSGVVQDSYGGITNMWGFGTILGSDLNGSASDLSITIDHQRVQRAEDVHVDAMHITVYYDIAASSYFVYPGAVVYITESIDLEAPSGDSYFEYPTAAVGVDHATLPGTFVIDIKRAAALGIGPAQKYSILRYETAAIDIAEDPEYQAKIFEAAAISIAAAEAFPAYMKVLAAAIGISTDEMYAVMHAEAAVLGIATADKLIAKIYKDAAVSISAVEALSKHFTEQVAAALGISTAELYSATHAEVAAISIAATGKNLVEILLAAAIDVAEATKLSAEIYKSEAIDVAEAIQLAALLKVAAALGITAVEDISKFLKVVAAAINIDGSISLFEVLLHLSASVDVTVDETLKRLLDVAASIGITASISFVDILKLLSASITTTGDIDLSAFIKQAIAIDISDAIDISEFLKALAASLTITSVAATPEVLITKGASVSVTEDPTLEVLKFLVAVLDIAAVEDTTLHAYLDAIAAVSVSGSISMVEVLKYISTNISISADEAITTAELLRIAATIGIGAVASTPEVLKGLAAAITATGDVKLSTFITEAFGIDISEVIDISSYLKALAASITITGVAGTPEILKNIPASLTITSDISTVEVLTHLAAVLDIAAVETTALHAYLDAIASVSVAGSISMIEVLSHLVANISLSAVEAITSAELIQIAAGIGIDAVISTVECLKGLAAAVTVTGDVKLSAFIMHAFGIDISDAIDIPSYLKALAASMTITTDATTPEILFHLTDAVGISASADFPVFLKAVSASINLDGSISMFDVLLHLSASIDIEEEPELHRLLVVLADIGISASISFVELLKLLSTSLTVTGSIDLSALTKQAIAIGIIDSIDISEFLKALAASMTITTDLATPSVLAHLAAAVGISAAEDLSLHAYLDAAASVSVAGSISMVEVLKKLAASVTIAGDIDVGRFIDVVASIGIGAVVDIPTYLKALAASVTVTGDVDFSVFIKHAVGIDLSEAIDIAQMKALVAAIGISETVATPEILIKRAASIGITTSEQYSALIKLAGAISIGAVGEIYWLKKLVASLSVSGDVKFEAYLNTLAVVVGVSAALENQVKIFQAAAIDVAESKKLSGKKLAAATIDIAETLKNLVNIYLSFSIGIDASEYLSTVDQIDLFVEAAIGIATSEDFSTKKLLTTAVGIATTLKVMPKTVLVAAVGIATSEDFPAFKKALQASINIEALSQFAATTSAEASIGIVADEMLSGLKKAAASVDVGEATALSVKKLIDAIFDISADGDAFFNKLALVAAISVVPVWSSPTYTQMIAWLVGDIRQDDRLKAEIEHAAYSNTTDTDFNTDALIYSGGDWFDGEWVQGLTFGPSIITLDTGEKVVGSGSIKATPTASDASMGFDFDAVADLSNYTTIEFWYKCHSDHVGKYLFFTLANAGHSNPEPSRYWSFLVSDDSWNKRVIQLGSGWDWSGVGFDATQITWFGFDSYFELVGQPIYIDGVKFYDESPHLKADIDLDDRLKAIFETDGRLKADITQDDRLKAVIRLDDD